MNVWKSGPESDPEIDSKYTHGVDSEPKMHEVIH